MYSIINNPTKSLTLNAPIEMVEQAMDNMQKTLSKVNINNITFDKKMGLTNQYEFSASEPLSMGSQVLVNIQALEGKTQLNMEVRRKMGAFNTSVEIQLAGQHMDKILKGIELYLNPPSEEEVKQQAQINETANNASTFITILGVGLVILYIVAL